MTTSIISEAERATIEKSVQVVVDEVMSAAERADLDGLLRMYADVPWTSVMNGGYFFPSIKAFDAAFRPGFSQMTRQSIKRDETRISVLSPNAAVVAMYGNCSSFGKNGSIWGGHFCLTFVLATVDGNWRIVHAHQSFVR